MRGTNGGRSQRLFDAHRNRLLLEDLVIARHVVHVRFGFATDGRHALDRVDGVVARGGFPGEHHGVGTVENSVGHVRGLRARRARGTRHGLQHLRRRHYGLARVVAPLDHALLRQEYLFHANLHTQVAASDHDAVGLFDNIVIVI